METKKTTEQRTAFYIRIETAEEIRITWRIIPLYLVFMWMGLFLIFAFLSNTVSDNAQMPFALLAGISFVIFLVYYLVMLMNTRPVFKEVKAAQRAGTVRVTGNKWSLTDPQTAIIKKDTKTS